ncbi:uncharacterized protein [Cherax quadricarinatus]|uniref:uncharacterized protein n=1 Tax=Cherax quadricarinatus TaxID=27406 RepID=UPI00387E6091
MSGRVCTICVQILASVTKVTMLGGRVMVLVLMVLSATLVQPLVSAECSGECQRRDSAGRCRTVFSCKTKVQAPVTSSSIFNVPCRRQCYRLVHGKCRLKFSCLLG